MTKKIISIILTAAIVLMIFVYFMDGKDQFVLSTEIESPKASLNLFISQPPIEYNLIDGFVSLNYDKHTKKGQGVISMMDRQEKVDYLYDETNHRGTFSLKGIQGSFSSTISEIDTKSILETKVMYQVDGMFAKLFQSLITKVIEQKLAEDHLRLAKQFQITTSSK